MAVFPETAVLVMWMLQDIHQAAGRACPCEPMCLCSSAHLRSILWAVTFYSARSGPCPIYCAA
jgi:hypothetical protein